MVCVGECKILGSGAGKEAGGGGSKTTPGNYLVRSKTASIWTRYWEEDNRG